MQNMNLTIRDKSQALTSAQLEDLFLSVEWSSGHYPDKLAIAMQNYETVYTAWNGDTLVGLISAMDDGIMTAYIHYLLVRPEYQGKGIGQQLITIKYSLLRRDGRKLGDIRRLESMAWLHQD